jgi:predicted dehydrogenase
MTEMINVGIIGAGSIAKRGHIPGYTGQPDAKLIGVCDIVGGRARRVAGEIGAPHACEDYRELLELEEVQAVSVCTANKFHAPIAIAALNAGKHVLCEKPPAMSTSEAQAMVDAAQANGRVLMICLNNRFQPEIQLLKQYIEAGELGKIYYAKTGILRRRGSAGGWFSQKSMSGGGALIDIGVHCLDWTWWLMGCPPPLQVYGQTYQEIGSYHLAYETSWTPADLVGQAKPADWAGDTDELAIATIRLAGGGTLRVEVSWALNNQKTTQYTELYGDRAGARLSPLTLFGQERGRLFDKSIQVPEQEQVRTHGLAIRHFLDCVQTGGQPLTTPQQIVNLMRMLDAIYESAETGELIKLD